MVAVPGVAAVFVVLAVALVRRGAMLVIPRGVPKVCAACLVASMMARLIRTVFVLMIAMHTHTTKVYPPGYISTKRHCERDHRQDPDGDRKARKALRKSCRATKGASITITTSDVRAFSLWIGPRT